MDTDPSPEVRPDAESGEEEGGPIKPFLEHLEDLRWVLIKIGSALLIGMAVCLGAAPQLLDILQWPLEVSGIGVKLEWLNPIGGFVASMKVALYGGLTFGLPFILYFIGEFIMPALKAREKKYFLRAFTIGGGLFLAGVELCYFWVLPISLKGIHAYNQWLGITTTIWRAEDYFQFVIMFMVGMGISFEVPVVLLTLVRVGILPHEWLVKGRKYIFVANLVFCCFITPDAISTVFMVIPVSILMEICIQISKHWERQKRRAEEKAAGGGGS